MVVVCNANAIILNTAEPESRTDRSIGGESIFSDIAIPSRLHLGYQNCFVVLRIDGYPSKISGIVSGLASCGCHLSRSKLADPINDINIARIGSLEHALVKLPIAIRSAGIGIVLNVKNRSVHSL